MARTGEHAPQSFTGFDRLADRAVAWLAERRRAAREREAARRAENPPPLFPRKRWDTMPPERRAGLWGAYDSATSAALGSPSIMTYGAAAARLGNAGRFVAMSRRGAADAAIRRATRYERGPFGYGVETVGDATLRPAAVFGAVREGSLGDLAYIHPEVARAYPTMKDAKVEMVPSAEWADRLAAAKAALAEAGGAGSTGAYAKATDTILVKGPSETEPLHMFADRADRTLVHEMQHAAQARDGLLGRAAGDYRTAAKEVDARNSANRRWLGPAERRGMPRMNTQDVRPEEVHMDDRGGRSPHETFRNFLATDEVPETLFGFPVVQREGDYTEGDLEFFRENPKAAGFYEMGDEEDVDEDVPQQAAGAGDTAKDVHGLVQKFKDHVRTYESRRAEPYRDVDGDWAVGYGSHFLADGTKVTPETVVTDRTIDDAFDADLARRVDLLAGHDRRQARFAVPNWRYMSPESRLMLLDVSWGRKDTLTERKSPGLFGELRAAGRDKAALDDAVRRHYPSYRKATDANGVVDESKTAGLQNRRIALMKALTGEDFSYDGKKWSTEKNEFVEE